MKMHNRDAKTGQFNSQGRFVMRLPMTKAGKLALESFKKHLNKDEYRLAVRFSGKRNGKKDMYTPLKNATSMRVYIHRKKEDPDVAILRQSLREQRIELEDKTNQVNRFKQAFKGLMED